MKTGDLHLHSLDQFDSQNNPERVAKRLSEMGARGFAVTQHGMMSAIDRMRSAAEKYGLKFIPGIEAYFQDPEDIQRRHLILLAMDDTGYKAICKAVTKSNDSKGFSVMNTEILNTYFGKGAAGHGHVIATSACIQGVIAMHLRRNEEIEKELEKLQRKLDKNAGDTDVTALTAKIDEITATVKTEKRKQTDEEKEQLATLRKQKKDAETRAENQQKLTAAITGMKSKLHSKEECRRIAAEETKKFVELFGTGTDGQPCFYMEIQNHGMDVEAQVYPVLAEIARTYRVPIVATNDCHIVDKSEEELLRRNILRALRFQEWQDMEPADKELYIKTDEEMVDWLSRIFPADVVEEGMRNIGTIIDRCDVKFEKGSHYPKFPSPDHKTANEMLEEEIRKGIQWRFPNGMDQQHIDMLNHELPVIESMGYADYHLIVKDFLEYGRLLGQVPDDKIEEAPLTIEGLREWIKENDHTIGFSIGPGRGSAVGSLICYLLGITSLDPIPYGLLFERFLNPERVSMPDIDSDLSYTVRSKVIEYVTAKYGKDAVCGIMTMNAQAPKGAIRIAAKYYGQSVKGNEQEFLGIADRIAKKVPSEPGTKFSTVCNEETGETVLAMLRREFNTPKELEIIRWATMLEGAFTTYGAHAAGIIISDNDDVSDYVPLRWNDKLKEWTTQCDMVQAEEEHGLLKMDFLGLRTLDVITDCIRMVKNSHGIEIDPLKIDMEDRDVYREIFSKGRTNSVFQFESSGMKAMLKRFKPRNFEDLIILVSMFRPGPLQYLDGVIDVKNGQDPVYLCDELKPILGKTYGAIVYQEQVMEIFQKLANYTLGGADLVRRFMSKKKQDKLAHERVAFVDGDTERNIKGCVANGISREAADKLFDQMTEFAKYAFNKSHAAAYAYNAYVTGWLKYHYPAEFLAAAMNWAATDKIPGLMHEAKLFGVKVYAPDVNVSEDNFTVRDGAIYFGMSAVKSVGKSGSEVLNERKQNGEFLSIKDFIQRTNLRKNVFENLCKAGAFDGFTKNRRAILFVYEDLKAAIDTVKKKQALVQEGKETAKAALEKAEAAVEEIMIPTYLEESLQTKMEEEKQYLGAYVSAHPMDEYNDPEDLGAIAIGDINERMPGTVVGVVSHIEVKHRKKDGKPMAFVTLEDLTGELQVKFFTKDYSLYKNMLTDGAVLKIDGIIEMEETGTDENGEPEYTPSMMPSTVLKVPKRKKVCNLTVSSYPLFHVDREAAFRERYEDKDGICLYIKDMATGQNRKARYLVSMDAAGYPGAELQ